MMHERYILRLEAKYRCARPYWFPTVWNERARQLAQTLCPVMQDLVQRWLDTGVEEDLKFEQYSMNDIMALAQTDYLGAIELMNAYILDPITVSTRLYSF